MLAFSIAAIGMAGIPPRLRIYQQIVSLPGSMGSGLSIWDDILSSHPDKLFAGYSLFLSYNTDSFLQETC
jgi:hypothetical protein